MPLQPSLAVTRPSFRGSGRPRLLPPVHGGAYCLPPVRGGTRGAFLTGLSETAIDAFVRPYLPLALLRHVGLRRVRRRDRPRQAAAPTSASSVSWPAALPDIPAPIPSRTGRARRERYSAFQNAPLCRSELPPGQEHRTGAVRSPFHGRTAISLRYLQSGFLAHVTARPRTDAAGTSATFTGDFSSPVRVIEPARRFCALQHQHFTGAIGA